MRDEQSDSAGRDGWASTVAALLGIVGLVFAPLFISGVEYLCFGTDHFENWLRRLGVHGALAAIYRPVVDLVRWVWHLL